MHLCGFLAISNWIEERFSAEDVVLFRCNSQLIVKYVAVKLLHAVPVSHDAALHGTLQA